MKMIRKALIFLIGTLISWTHPIRAQEIMEANIADIVNTTINSLPGPFTNVYSPPGGSDRTKWESVVSKIIAREYATAATEAKEIGYELVNVKDAKGSEILNLYLLQKINSSQNYWGTYVFNDEPDRPQLVIQSPHPIKDSKTGSQGIYVFRETGARAFFLNGTNRCNSTIATNCSGSTSICGNGSEKYRISDVAHHMGAFQIVTELLFDAENNYFIQLHGFGKGSSDPYVIMSIGARSIDGINKMPDIQQALFEEDNQLTFRNSLDGWDRLLGFTNTQGRYINTSSDPCGSNASIANGRFIHIEQELTRLRSGLEQWKKMANALSKAFPKKKTDPTVTSFGDEMHEFGLYPNPVGDYLRVKNNFEGTVNLEILTIGGTSIFKNKIQYGQHSRLVSSIKSGIYIYIFSSNNKVLKTGKLIKT